jgi:hypothetical protein
MRFQLRRPSPAMVVALLALTAAISGVAVAAPAINHKAKAASAQRGPRGFRGSRGPRGFRGPAGVVPQIAVVESPHITLNPGQTTFEVDPNGFQANCPAGETVLGTGFDDGGVGSVGFVESFGVLVGGFISNSSSVPTTVFLQGICGFVPGGAVAASARAVKATGEANYQAALRRIG